jgi:IS30 family transposase
MDNEVQNLLNQLPVKPPRSKLEPYRELIFALLEKNWRYRDIAALFKDKFSISVAPSTLHNFVKVRTRRKQMLRSLVNGKSEERLAGTVNRSPRIFEFTPGETLKLSPKERKDK